MKVEDYVADLFAAGDAIHSAHLRTKSYARHKALSLYEDIRDYADNFVEVYQGQMNQLINEYEVETQSLPDEEAEAYLEGFCKDVLINAKNEFSQNMEEYGHFVNDIETLIAKVYHTLYKLRFLK
jgi:hypothetical protein